MVAADAADFQADTMPNYRNLHLLSCYVFLSPPTHRNMQMVMYISLELGNSTEAIGVAPQRMHHLLA